MTVVYYSKRTHIKVNKGKDTSDWVWSGTQDRSVGGGPQNTPLPLAITIIYTIKFWYSFLNETIVKRIG